MAILAGEDILAEDLYHIRKPTMTAAEDLTAGDRVGVSFLYDDHVSKAFSTEKTWNIPTGGHATMLMATCAISTDNVAYVYRKTGTNTVSVVVVKYNEDMTTTVGTAVDLTTGVYTSLRNLAIAKIDTDKFVAFYVESADNTNLKGVICTVSGTTITNGTETTYTTGASPITTLGACQLDTGKGFVIDGTNKKAYAFTVSGTTPTIGTVEALGFTGTLFYVVQTATDHAVLSSNSGSATYLTAFTVSGTTITEGTQSTNFTDTGNMEYNSLISPATDVVVFSVRPSGGSSDIEIRVATISGTTITVGSAYTNTNGATNALGAISSTLIAVGSDTPVILSRSGTTLSTYYSSSPLRLRSALNGFNGMYSGAMVQVHSRFLCHAEFGTVTANYLMQGFSISFLGIAQATVQADATVEVIVEGIDANQSGLIAGNYYQVGDNGALTQISQSATTDTPKENSLLLSLSATAVKII